MATLIELHLANRLTADATSGGKCLPPYHQQHQHLKYLVVTTSRCTYSKFLLWYNLKLADYCGGGGFRATVAVCSTNGLSGGAFQSRL